MPSKWLLALILVLPFAQPTLAQSSDGSASPLGHVAKRNDASKKENAPTKAKRVFTDEDMSLRRSPIPAIALQGVDNSQEVLDAIHEYRRTHDAAETERIVHQWFDEQSEVLSDAIDTNVKLTKHNQLKMEAAQDASPYVYDGDVSKLQQRQLSERWSQRMDARTSQDNWLIINRIQQAFVRVRCDGIFNRGKSPYDWFRIRNANGVGTY